MRKRETGASPVRSRHCKGEPRLIATEHLLGKEIDGCDPEPGDLPFLFNTNEGSSNVEDIFI